MMGKQTLRILMAVLLCALLLSSAAALAGPGISSPAAYVIEQGTASGGGYSLAAGTWQASGSATGPGYRLDAAGGRILQGAGCCCTFLPYVLRGW